MKTLYCLVAEVYSRYDNMTKVTSIDDKKKWHSKPHSHALAVR